MWNSISSRLGKFLGLKNQAGVFLVVALILALGSTEFSALRSSESPDTARQAPKSRVVELVKAVSPAVVSITSRPQTGSSASPDLRGMPNEFWRRFFGDTPIPPGNPTPRQSFGSGFIIDADGLILTNNHVIGDGEQVTVSISNGKEFKATVIGKDEKTDIALIRIKAGTSLPTVPLGDSSALEIGEGVLAIGNPFGLEHTVTSGIVSAKGRRIGAGPYDNFIQTDASINPGNSGGPLINFQGEVVGINTAIFSQSGGNIGIGFAIPVNLVKDLLPQLKTTGHVTRGWLGVVIQHVTPAIAESLGMKTERGALVANVSDHSPAALAGMEVGDVILEFDGEDVKQSNDLPLLVARTPVGKKVKVDVLRDGKRRELVVQVGQLKEEEHLASVNDRGDLGLSVQSITPQMAESLGMRAAEGVVITSVAPGSTAAQAGLRAGDVLLKINRSPIRTLSDYREVVGKIQKGKSVLFLVQRGGTTLFFAGKNIG